MQNSPLTSKEMRVIELNAQWLGIELGMLMQQAGREVARVIEMNTDLDKKDVTILCGGGGNGGDGMVAARYLHEAGARVEVFLVGSIENISSPDTSFNWAILENLYGIQIAELETEKAVKSCKAILDADIVIDAILGFGLKSKLREPILTAVKMFNKSEATKYSVDVPTGIDSDTGVVHGAAVQADATITLHAPKPGLLKAKECVGDLFVVAIGIPPEAEHICGPGDLYLFNRPRRPDSHKGDSGHVLVLGGSDLYSGAPALTGMAALRTGADLVSIIAPDPVVSAIRSYSPNLMVRSLGTQILLPECVNHVLDVVKGIDVVALGPGLGLDPLTSSAAITIAQDVVELGKRLVIDADGLKSITGSGLTLDPEKCVLTPHLGELSILMDQASGTTLALDERVELSMKAATTYNSVILLKGGVDVVTHPDGRYKLNHTGVPAMTVGGTGDVLTGIVAALLARGEDAFHAAAAAAFVSGLAGEFAHDELGDHILATDCIDMIPEAME